MLKASDVPLEATALLEHPMSREGLDELRTRGSASIDVHAASAYALSQSRVRD